MGQTTILIMILTIVSKVFGFLRESFMAYYIGAGELKSIYTTATTIPNILVGIVSAGFISGYIPIMTQIKNNRGDEEANKYTSNLINLFMIYGTFVLILVFIFAEPLSKLFSPDLKHESLNLAKNYTRIIIFSIYAFLYASVIRGYLNFNGNFIDPVLSGIIFNIFIIATTILTGIFNNPYILIFGVLLSYVIQYIKYPSASKKNGFKYYKYINFNDKDVIQLLIIIVPIILSSAVDQLSILVDNTMASAFFGVASVSKIFYAKTMLNFIMGVVTMTVATVSFPEIARLGQTGEIDGMKRSVSSAIILTMILVIPATFGMMALSNPIIKLAFERNAFTSEDTLIVSSLMVSYGPFIIFTSFMKIFGNAFYAINDSKTPVKIILIQQAVNIVLNFILINFFGLNGLAIATAISTAIGAVIMFIAFKNKFGRMNFKANLASITKITIASLIMSAVAIMVYNFGLSIFGSTISLIIAVALAGSIYLLSIIILKLDEINKLLDYFNKIKEGRKKI